MHAPGILLKLEPPEATSVRARRGLLVGMGSLRLESIQTWSTIMSCALERRPKESRRHLWLTYEQGPIACFSFSCRLIGDDGTSLPILRQILDSKVAARESSRLVPAERYCIVSATEERRQVDCPDDNFKNERPHPVALPSSLPPTSRLTNMLSSSLPTPRRITAEMSGPERALYSCTLPIVCASQTRRVAADPSSIMYTVSVKGAAWTALASIMVWWVMPSGSCLSHIVQSICRQLCRTLMQ